MKQLWGKYQDCDWELLDAEDEDNPIEYLLQEYKLAYRNQGWKFQIRAQQ